MRVKHKYFQKDIASILNRLNTTVLVISLFILTAACLLFIYVSTVNIMTRTLKEEAKTSAKRIEWVVKSYKNIAQGIGSIPELSSSRLSPAVKELILANKTNEYKLVRCKTIRPDGYSDMDDQYRGDRYYFKEALKGNVTINDPLLSRTDGKLALIIGAPVWRYGIYNGKIDSVLFCSIEPHILSDILKEFNISKNSRVYIIGQEGNTIASQDPFDVLTGYSNIKASKTNSKLKKIADFEKNTLDGTLNTSIINSGTKIHCYASCLIEGTPGWALIIDAPVTDFLSNLWVALAFIFTVSVIIIIVSRQLIRKHSKMISEPVKQMAERLRQAAVGDFKTDVNLEDSIEEIKIIANATHSLVSRMDSVLNGISSDFATSNLGGFIHFEDYNSLNERFEKSLKIHLCIMDNKMNKIIGTINENAEKSFSNAILINSKAIGKCIISPDEGCISSDENLQAFTEGFAGLIGLVIENTISREIHYKSREKNNFINNEKIFQLSENLAKDLLEWTEKIKQFENTTGNSAAKKLFEEFEKQSLSFSSTIHENAEYSRFTDFNFTLKENDYQVPQLISNIENRVSKNASNKENVNIITREIPEETLFGDQEAIEKIITRIILFIESRNPDRTINAIPHLEKNTFGYTLMFNFIIEKHQFTERDIELFTKLERPVKNFESGLIDEEVKLFSACTHLWHMNGSLKTVSIDDTNYKLIVEIPQL